MNIEHKVKQLYQISNKVYADTKDNLYIRTGDNYKPITIYKPRELRYTIQ